MTSRMSEFRQFVSLHPLLRDDVKNGKRTWQNIYEEWVLYGDGDTIWGKYINSETKEKPKSKDLSSIFKMDGVKNALGYVKKINPDKVNNTLNNVQKVIQIIQTVNGGKSVSVPAVTSAFSDWWD